MSTHNRFGHMAGPSDIDWDQRCFVNFGAEVFAGSGVLAIAFAILCYVMRVYDIEGCGTDFSDGKAAAAFLSAVALGSWEMLCVGVPCTNSANSSTFCGPYFLMRIKPSTMLLFKCIGDCVERLAHLGQSSPPCKNGSGSYISNTDTSYTGHVYI